MSYLSNKKVDFPFALELLVWLIYVCLYKYDYYLATSGIASLPSQTFPHPQLILYALLSTAYLIPYYRFLVPALLHRKQYAFLLILTLLYIAYVPKAYNVLIDWLFTQANTSGSLADFYQERFALSLALSKNLIAGWNLRLLLTDLIAFSCVAFVRYAFENEIRRYQLEKDNLNLQLTMLKNQLQPHFLFNTLNSLYGLSLTGSKDTSRFILLLSDMMRYILYDCNKERIALSEEITFLENYFEMEQKKYPNARISWLAQPVPAGMVLPPLLFLPLVENSFKHGAHRMADHTSVRAELTATDQQIRFTIENDVIRHELKQPQPGGIGLVNIRQRLALYYPNQHELIIDEQDHIFRAQLVLTL